MISITELFHKVILNEAAEDGTILHLQHPVEEAIMGRPKQLVRRLRDLQRWVQNQSTEGSISVKVDGKVSTKGGKDKDGNPFAMYKGEGEHNIPLFSEKEIDEWTKKHNKQHLKDSLILTLKAASHPDLEPGTKFQADTLLHNTPSTFKGNVISYMKPNSRLNHITRSTQGAVAIHTLIKDGKSIPAPNMSHLSTDDVNIPSLSVDHIKRSATPEELKKLEHHISQGEQIFQDSEVARITRAIARHRDPNNKQGHRHLFFRGFNNAFQRGEHGETRNADSLMNYAVMKLANAKGNKEKDRILAHMKFIGSRKGTSSNLLAIHKMFEGHDHFDAARDIIIKIANRTNPDLKPIDPATGKINYNMGEGWVHTIPGLGSIKLVSREFTSRNARESEARKKKPIVENEGGAAMTASGGGIAGMGYNLGGPAPDDVAVPPLKNRMASKAAKPFRRKLMTKLLGRMNVGREAY